MMTFILRQTRECVTSPYNDVMSKTWTIYYA